MKIIRHSTGRKLFSFSLSLFGHLAIFVFSFFLIFLFDFLHDPFFISSSFITLNEIKYKSEPNGLSYQSTKLLKGFVFLEKVKFSNQSDYSFFINIFFGVPHLATFIFGIFVCGFYVITSFVNPFIIRYRGSNPRPLNREPSALTIRPWLSPQSNYSLL